MKSIILTLQVGRNKYTSKKNFNSVVYAFKTLRHAADHVKGISRVPKTIMTGVIKFYMPHKFLTTEIN